MNGLIELRYVYVTKKGQQLICSMNDDTIAYIVGISLMPLIPAILRTDVSISIIQKFPSLTIQRLDQA